MIMQSKMARWSGIVSIALVASALLASGQATSPQQAGIDPAVLAKANGGDTAAQVAVGEIYAEGKGVARDLKLAAEWYQRAADKGDVGGELHLAALHRDGGKGFPRDMTQAAAWYRKAAEEGDVTAQGTLGTLYSMGQGVEQSYVEAYYWLDLAAAVNGPKQAQYAANRQMIGIHITADELAEIQDREAAWKAAHLRPGAAR
jgi:TPR repeat protein